MNLRRIDIPTGTQKLWITIRRGFIQLSLLMFF